MLEDAVCAHPLRRYDLMTLADPPILRTDAYNMLWRDRPASNRLSGNNPGGTGMAANLVGKLLMAGAAGAAVGAAVVATAAPEFNTRGNRFKPLSYAELTPEQRAFADREIAGGRKPENGPFNIYLRSPEMSELSGPLSEYLRFKAPTPRKLKEIAIMLTARYWGGQYVWYSHRQQALDAGLSPPFIAAMAAGERPANMSPDEATMYD